MNSFPLPLNIALNEGERNEWTLLSPFQYIDPDLGLITVPEGYTTNFVSVPRIPIIFDLVGAYGHAAAVLHDYLYEHTTQDLISPYLLQFIEEFMTTFGKAFERVIGHSPSLE